MDPGNPSTYALFLDLDGTLIDIAPRPDDVVIQEGLASLLDAMTRRLEGALAILTGRAIADIDNFLAPLAPVAAGSHGAEIRSTPGGAIETVAGPIDVDIVEAVREFACRNSGTIVELKPASVAIHYRLAPASEPMIEEALRGILAGGPDHLILCRGRRVFEIVPRNVSKGMALETLVRLPSFRGRRPVMIGDDVTDISALEAAARLGGSGLKVAGELFSATEADFAGPAAVRAWLAAQAGRST